MDKDKRIYHNLLVIKCEGAGSVKGAIRKIIFYVVGREELKLPINSTQFFGC